MTTAQELDRSITVERSIEVPNELNEPVEMWMTLIVAKARRRDASDGEKVGAGQIGSSLMSRFVVRSSERTRDVRPTDRIQHDGRLWNIQGIKEADEGRRRFLEITAITDAD